MGRDFFAVTSVLITDGHELAGLGAARSLGRAGHVVSVAVPQGIDAPVGKSRYVARVIASPNPWVDQPAYRQFLQIEAPKHDVLLPISEAAILATAACRHDLGRTLLLLPSDASLRYTLSKYHATRAAQAAGLAVPQTVFLSDGNWPADLLPLVDSLAGLGYPLLIKHDNCLLPSGQYVRGKTERVDSPLQARALLAELRALGAQVIAQKPIPGHGAGVFLLRHGQKTLLRFAHERLHEVPYTGGVSSLRMSCHDEKLVAQSERFLAALDYQGVAMCEFRKTPSGEPLFLEINGRLWGSLALALHCGVDFPRTLLLAMQGMPVPAQSDYPDGLRCRNLLPGEVSHLASLWRAKDVSLSDKLVAAAKQVLLTFDPQIRHDHFWFDDPEPAAKQTQNWLSEFAQRLRSRVERNRQMQSDKALLSEELARTESRFGALPTPRRILTLCLGNICRSPFAEHYLRLSAMQKGLPMLVVESAGFLHHDGRATPTRFVELVKPHGVDLSHHRAQRVQREQIDAADLILVMDVQNLRAFHDEFPDAVGKTFLIGALAKSHSPEIPDPYLLPVREAEASYRLLAESCAAVITRIVHKSTLRRL